MHITLAVPGLLPGGEFIDSALQATRLPALEALLARATPLPATPSRGLTGWLGAGAAARLASDGGDPSGGVWLCADPVHLAAREGRLYLVDSRVLQISREEADTLVDALNRHFSADGLEFKAPDSRRWYLRFPVPLQLTTTPADEAAGRSVDERLPRGPDGMRLHALLNEVQMLLAPHPVNEAREERGEMPVNSVWPWDAPGQVAPAAGWDQVFGDAPVARAFAANRGLPAHPLPEGPAGLGSAGRVLVVLDGLDTPAAYSDAAAWRDAVIALEDHWFAPMARTLARRKLDTLEIHAIGDRPRCFLCRPRDRLRVWRRAGTLAQCLATPKE